LEEAREAFSLARYQAGHCEMDQGVIAQLVERLNGIQEVGGSIPPGSTIQFLFILDS
jgi:hypothetical protein